MKVPEMIARYEVMACPVCAEVITAEVTVLPKLGNPVILDGTKVDVPISTEMTRFHVTHHCRGRIEAEAGRIVAETAFAHVEGDE